MQQTIKTRLACALIASAVLGMSAIAGTTTPAPAKSKITASLDRLMAAEDGPHLAWVFFADKGIEGRAERTAAIAELERTYDARAIARRRVRGVNAERGGAIFDQRDFPLVGAYVDSVRTTGATLRVESTWLNAVSVSGTREQIEAIGELPFVTKVQPVRRFKRHQPVNLEDRKPAEPQTSTASLRALDYGNATSQLTQINLIKLHADGYTGAGVIIGILDTGFRQTHVAFQDAAHPLTVIAQHDFVDNDPDPSPQAGDPSGQHEHGTLILGTLASYRPGTLVGGAFDASYVLCKTEDITGEYQGEEDNYVAGLQFAEANGADLTTSSLGYIDWYTQADLDGQTAVTTIAMNTMNDNGVHSCTAAGNEYHDSNPSTSSIIAPADAYRVITCGAVESSGSIAGFSSDGPTADGRVKPEVLALGSGTDTIDAFSDTGYGSASGTSLSTPLVAGAVACIVQAHPDWTVDELRDALFASASESIATGTFDPAFVRGYGIIDAWGAVQDCDENGIPDGVDIANGAQDCQGNGVLDSCEFADGSALDCNNNGIPDICDITPPGMMLADTEPPVLGWVEISSTGTALSLSDDGEATVSMGFANPVFGSSDVTVANNGGIGFLPGENLDYVNEPLPADVAFGGNRALLAFWDDLDDETGNVYYQTIGAAPDRTFIVEWKDRPHYSGDFTLDGDEVTFQLQVFESATGGAHAQVLYQDTNFLDGEYNNGASATVGYQHGDGTADQWSYNSPVITPSLVLSLKPAGAASSADDNGNGIPDECEGDCPADINGDGLLTIDDVLAFIDAFTAGHPAADINDDGLVNIADVTAFIDAFTAGC